LRHARIHDQLASNPQYAGGIGWCAFDYNTHSDFGSGDRICYHGVTDIFREPKPAAGFYKSQCDPEEEVVLEPAFHWARGDQSVGFSKAVVCSNCDHLKFYVKDKLIAEVDPDHTQFPHLRYAPFVAEIGEKVELWGDLRIDGYIQGKQAISKSYSGRGVEQRFSFVADDLSLNADGADTTRVVLAATDEFGAICSFSCDAITLEVDGPADVLVVAIAKELAADGDGAAEIGEGGVVGVAFDGERAGDAVGRDVGAAVVDARGDVAGDGAELDVAVVGGDDDRGFDGVDLYVAMVGGDD